MAVPAVRDSRALARFGFHCNQLESPTRDMVVKGEIGGSYVLTVVVVVGMGDCPRHILPFISSGLPSRIETPYDENWATLDQQCTRLLLPTWGRDIK